MKREVAAEIVESLKEAGVDFAATLTEANLHDLVMALGEDKAIHHVPVTREEEGIGICAGAYLGGKKPAMVMMNAGFLLSTNALATVCIHPGIPVLLIIGHSGGVGEENAGHATVGALTEPVLQAMHIVYEKVGCFDEIRPAIRDSQMLARSSRRPTANSSVASLLCAVASAFSRSELPGSSATLRSADASSFANRRTIASRCAPFASMNTSVLAVDAGPAALGFPLPVNFCSTAAFLR